MYFHLYNEEQDLTPKSKADSPREETPACSKRMLFQEVHKASLSQEPLAANLFS